MIIKKYQNRRLYNTQLKKYITFQYLEDLIIKKNDFKIIDATNNEDVTKKTLVQILKEIESKIYNEHDENTLKKKIGIYLNPELNQDYKLFILESTNSFENIIGKTENEIEIEETKYRSKSRFNIESLNRFWKTLVKGKGSE